MSARRGWLRQFSATPCDGPALHSDARVPGKLAIPYDGLPKGVFEFAAAFGLTWYLEKRYGVSTASAL